MCKCYANKCDNSVDKIAAISQTVNKTHKPACKACRQRISARNGVEKVCDFFQHIMIIAESFIFLCP